MKSSDLLNLLDFSQPIKVNTRNGVRLIRKSPVSDEFWKLYRWDKDACKGIMEPCGISLSKFRDEWNVTWWAGADGRFILPADYVELAEPEPELDLLPLLRPEGLFPYQLTSVQMGVRSMTTYGRVLLGHGTGMGKTAIALGIARERGRRVAVVCPKPIVADWYRMAKIIGVELHEVCGWEWAKTGKSKLGNWVGETDTFRFTLPDDVDLVFDEVHRAKGLATQNANLLWSATQQKIPTIALSATIADDPTKLWALGYFLALHTGGSDFYRFLANNGCKKTRFGFNFQGGKDVLKRIHKHIFPDRGNRLRPIDVGDAFPETSIHARAFSMDSAREISQAYSELLERVEEIRAKESVHASQGMILAETTRARQRIELLKAPAMCAMAKDLIEEGNSVFIAVNFTETREFMMKELKTTCAIYGGQNDIERRGCIDAFQADRQNVIIGIIQACREGLNLHDLHGNRPRVAIIMPCQSVYDLKQVLGRVHRAGGKSKSLQWVVYAAGVDIEEKICESLDGKLKRLDTLMDGTIDPSINLLPKEEEPTQF